MKNQENYSLNNFQVEELENRLENRWCTTTVTDNCKKEAGEGDYVEYYTEKC